MTLTMSTKKHIFFVISILLTLFYFTYDLDNLDGLRQGTEGFYLQVSKEMEAKDSYLTPYYRGERHWSKPPLHFLFPLPFSKIGALTHLHSARLSIAILTIALLMIASFWTKRHFQIETHTTFLFMACTVGMFKYARIFMMEIPLSLLTFVSILFYYDYIKFKIKKYLIYAISFGAAAILIKGPVSILISGFALTLYTIYIFSLRKQIKLKSLVLFSAGTIGIGSLWFIISYINYGDEFFNYFFLRENVGKFTAKSYPIRHVIQGLLIFTLPWSLFLPYSYLSLKDFFQSKNTKEENVDLIVYLLINAFAFLIVWLIPSQRSHHYAMPAVPFFLVIILITLIKPYSQKSSTDKRYNIFKVGNVLLFVSSLLVTLILVIVCYYIDVILPNKNFFWPLVLFLTILFGSSLSFLKSKTISLKAFSAQTFIGITWVVLAPNFIPTFIPQTVQDIIGERDVIASVRKPYFVEEALNRSITLKRPNEIADSLNDSSIYLLRYEDFINYKLSSKSKTLHEWTIWRRRTTVKQIVNALKIRDISSLKQKYVLFEKD